MVILVQQLGGLASSSIFLIPEGELILCCHILVSSTKRRHFRREHNVRDLSVAPYPSRSVSHNHSCGFSGCILLPQVQTSLYWRYLQSHTLATAGCISKDKPIMFNVSADSLWPLMKSVFSLWLWKAIWYCFAINLMCLQAAFCATVHSYDFFPRLHMGKWIKSKLVKLFL